MEVAYHPEVRREVIEILRYYHAISPALADEFHQELQNTINCAAENPVRFHRIDKAFRRANLMRFPYHVIYEVCSESIRIMIVRHNRRHPDFGMQRT